MPISQHAQMEVQAPVTAQSRTARQAIWFALHVIGCLAVWGAAMMVATFMNPQLDPPILTIVPLVIAFVFPFLAGWIANSLMPSEAASLVWYGGIIWILVIALWVLGMPTGPSACYHCGPNDKLWLTFFSFNRDSNLLDGQGRFLGTWPAVAMIGYGIGARIALRGKNTALLSR